MRYSWTGFNLEVDLTQRKLGKSEVDSQFYRTYLGGRGANARLFWDRVPPEVDPFSPQNLLIFQAGVLCGTCAPAANRATITTRSPQTNLLTYSTLGGFWAPELKYAGYDSIVISGKAEAPVYLFINDDVVEIRDASQLWGKDTIMTRKMIAEELKNDKAQIVCIGPAGENKVSYASIEHDFGSSVSRAGIGAVMGNKNLKAIAVYGTKDIATARPPEFTDSCRKILGRADKLRQWYEDWPEAASYILDYGCWGNIAEYGLIKHLLGKSASQFTAEFLAKFRIREIGCYNCPVRGRSVLSIPKIGNVTIKCAAWSCFMLATRIVDLEFAATCDGLCQKYGLDIFSTALSIAFAIDLFQRGILTKKDTDGMLLEEKNAEMTFSLIEKIARRQGIGDVLANGVYAAARQIGNGAEEYAYHTKKLEPPSYPFHLPYIAFANAVSERADYSKSETFLLQAYPKAYFTDSGQITDRLREDIQSPDPYFLYPSEFLQRFWRKDYDWSGADTERVCQHTYFDMNTVAFVDACGLCWYWAGFWPRTPLSFKLIVELLSQGTGVDFSEAEAFKIANRASALIRSYNVRLGIRRKDDTIPEKFFREEPKFLGPSSLPVSRLDRGNFNKLLDRFYELRGWNSDGIPTGETLNALDLRFIREDLERRGIL